MADNADFSLLVKILALEALVIDLTSREYLRHPDPAGVAATHRAHMRQVFERLAIPGLDAAASDHAVGEIAEAIDQILENAGQTAIRIADERRRP
jgi:hypothetical protein